MSPELTTKVRLVRCPKCRQLLAELPEIPVYKCGGCGVTLQARRKSASVNDTEAARRIGFDHASEDGKSRSSGRHAALLESGECSSDQDYERDPIMSSEGSESGNWFSDMLSGNWFYDMLSGNWFYDVFLPKASLIMSSEDSVCMVELFV